MPATPSMPRLVPRPDAAAGGPRRRQLNELQVPEETTSSSGRCDAETPVVELTVQAEPRHQHKCDLGE